VYPEITIRLRFGIGFGKYLASTRSMAPVYVFWQRQVGPGQLLAYELPEFDHSWSIMQISFKKILPDKNSLQINSPEQRHRQIQVAHIHLSTEK